MHKIRAIRTPTFFLLGLLLLPPGLLWATAAEPALHPGFVLHKDGSYSFSSWQDDPPPIEEQLRQSRNRLLLALLLQFVGVFLCLAWFAALIIGTFTFLLTLGLAGSMSLTATLILLLVGSVVLLALHLCIFLPELKRRRKLKERINNLADSLGKKAYQKKFSRQKSLVEMMFFLDIVLGLIQLGVLASWILAD